MVYVSEGLNPKSQELSISQTLSPIVQQARSNIKEKQAQQQQIQQNQILGQVLQGIAQKGENVSANDIFSMLAQGGQRGLSQQNQQQFIENYPKIGEHLRKQQETNKAQNAPQKLPKSTDDFIKSAYIAEQNAKVAQTASKALRDIVNRKNVSKPGLGTLSPRLYDEATKKDLGEMQTYLPQLLYYHKGLFPRGITQGEYLALSKKLPSAGQSYEEQVGSLDAFDRLTALATEKADKIRKAIKRNGGTVPAYLEFDLEDIDKEAEQEWDRVLKSQGIPREQTAQNPNQMDQIQGEGAGMPGTPEVLGRSQGEKPQYDQNTQFLVREKATGQMIPVPKQYFDEARNDPDYEVVDQGIPADPTLRFGETEDEAASRRASDKVNSRSRRKK